MKRKITAVLLGLVAALCLFAGCNKKQSEPQQDARPTFAISGKPSGNAIDVSEKTLVLSIPEYYKSMSPRWTSSEPQVATITNAGLLTLLSAGETTISVSLLDDISKKDSFVLTLTGGQTQPAESISIISPREQISLGDKTFTMTARFNDEHASGGFLWSVSDPGILAIAGDADGRQCTFSAVKTGKVTVIVRDSQNEQVKDECEILVVSDYYATAIDVYGTVPTNTLIMGESIRYYAIPVPHEASLKPVEWASDNDDVISVTKDGNITANSTGSANVTVTVDNGETAQPLVKTLPLKVVERDEYYESFEDVYYIDGKKVSGSLEITASSSGGEDLSLSLVDDEQLLLGNTRYALKAVKTGTESGKWSYVDVKLPAVKAGKRYQVSFYQKFLQDCGDDVIFYYGILNPQSKLIFPDPARPGDYCSTDSYLVSKFGYMNTLTVQVNADYEYITLRLLGVTSGDAQNAEYSYILDDIKINRLIKEDNAGSLGGEFVNIGANVYCRFDTQTSPQAGFVKPLGKVFCGVGNANSWRGMSTRIYKDAFSAGRYTFYISVYNSGENPLPLYADINFNGSISNGSKEIKDLTGKVAPRLESGKFGMYKISMDLTQEIIKQNSFVQISVFSMSGSGHSFEFGDIKLDWERLYNFENVGSFGGEFTSVVGQNGAVLSDDFVESAAFEIPVVRVRAEGGAPSVWRGVSLRLQGVTEPGEYTISFKIINRGDATQKVYLDVAGAAANSDKVMGTLEKDGAGEYTYTVNLNAPPQQGSNFIQLFFFFMSADTGIDFELGDVKVDFKAQ